MHIWVDGQCFQSDSKSRGIGRYVWELLRAMKDAPDPPHISLSLNAALSDEAIVAREALGPVLGNQNIHVWEGPSRNGEAFEGYTTGRRLGEMALAHHVNCIAPDIALTASPFEHMGKSPIPLPPSEVVRAPQAAIFYDAIPYRFADQYLNAPGVKRAFLRQLEALEGYDLMLCISEFARKELAEIHPELEGVNIAAGLSSSIRDLMAKPSKRDIRDRLGIEDGYVLYVGANDWRKNVRAMVEAYSQLPRDLVDKHPLVMAGTAENDLYRRDRMSWTLSGLPRDKLIRAGHVSDADLVELYRGASVLLQPSIMEGFGLPSLEALTAGIPVLAGDAGAVPEVVRSPELLFDPYNSGELARKLERLLRDPETMRDAVAHARENSAHMTWENSAADALKALRRVVERHGQSNRQTPREGSAGRPARQVLRDVVENALPELARSDPRAARTLAIAEVEEPRKARLLVDATHICGVDHRSGIQRVVRQTISNMVADHVRDVRVFYCNKSGSMLEVGGDLRQPPEDSALTLRPGSNDVMLMLDSAWHLIDRQLPRLEEHRMRGGQVVFCLYDLVPIRAYAFCVPNMSNVFANWLRHALNYATGFACISKAVADELLDLLEAIGCNRRIDVGYWQLGADLVPARASTTEDPSVASLPGGDAPHFLMVGTMEPRKGYGIALDAFERLWDGGADVRLTIVGQEGWASEHTMRRIKESPELGRRLFWHSRAGDAELERYYRDATALISSSFAEGFGLPLVEAGRHGKPVIASDIPVFREVSSGANGATFFEQGSPEALAEAVRRFLREGPDHPSANDAHVSWPTWRDSAEQLYQLATGGDWYRTYEPEGPAHFKDLQSNGEVLMKTPIPTKDKRVTIDVVEGPINRSDDGTVDYVLKVTNPTKRVWSSKGENGNRFVVNFAWKRLHTDTLATIEEGSRVHIPLVLQPSAHHYVRFTIPKAKDEKSMVRFDAVQEGSAWFSLETD